MFATLGEFLIVASTVRHYSTILQLFCAARPLCLLNRLRECVTDVYAEKCPG